MSNIIVTGSLVIYHNSEEDIKKTIKSFLGNECYTFLIVVDNSSDDFLSKLFKHSRVKYINNNKNVGFGAGHNIAFKEAIRLNSSYHIVLNPDVWFNSYIIKKLIIKSKSDSDIGLIMPKIIYPDGSIQYLCKLIPSPLDLLFRRFLTNKKLKIKLENKYELRFFSYTEEAEIPILSGCFMFIKTSILKKVHGFDERFFMYLEDVDLCRRIGQVSKVLYYPKVSVVHNYEKGSYKSKRLLKYHIESAIKYFNKWGWIFDKKRKEINYKTLNELNYKKNK